jgi:hypothetical protein
VWKTELPRRTYAVGKADVAFLELWWVRKGQPPVDPAGDPVGLLYQFLRNLKVMLASREQWEGLNTGAGGSHLHRSRMILLTTIHVASINACSGFADVSKKYCSEESLFEEAGWHRS